MTWFFFNICDYPQVSRKGRVEKVDEVIKLSTELNQRNNRSLCQQIYQYSCAKGLLQTFYWPRYCLKLFLTGNEALLSIFSVWINPSKSWIAFCCYFFLLLVLSYFLLVCKLFNWAAESDHSQLRAAEGMLKCKWFRQSYTTNEFVTGGSRFLQPLKMAQKPFCLSVYLGFVQGVVALMGLVHALSSAWRMHLGALGRGVPRSSGFSQTCSESMFLLLLLNVFLFGNCVIKEVAEFHGQHSPALSF